MSETATQSPNPDPSPSVQAAKPVRDGRRMSVVIVAISILAAGLTFMLKLYEFVAAASTGALPGVVTGTVLPYFFASAGFLSLAAWAWANGHYKNIEEPKRDMLRWEEHYERVEMRGDDLFY